MFCEKAPPVAEIGHMAWDAEGHVQEPLVDGIHDPAIQYQQVRLELDLRDLEVRAQVRRTSCSIDDGPREAAARTVRIQLEGQLQRELVQIQDIARVGDGIPK